MLGAWNRPTLLTAVRPEKVTPPVMTSVLELTMAPPEPLAFVMTAGLSAAPLRRAERTTGRLAGCATQVMLRLAMLIIATVPAPLATVHRSFGSAIWTL